MDSLAIALGLLVAAIFGAFIGIRVNGWLQRRRVAKAAHHKRELTRYEVLATVLESAPYGVAVVDRHHDVVVRNSSMRDLGVMKGNQLVSQAWDHVEGVFETGRDDQFELSPAYFTRVRNVVAVSCRAEKLEHSAGQFVVVYADDDTENRRMEAARRDFVANVSHELKTPVGAMAVLAEALVESKDDPESVEYFGKRVVFEANRLGSMVVELIELSRLQGAERIHDPEVVSIDGVIDAAIARSATTAEAAEITLSAGNPMGLEVMGDHALLVTAVSNLITNAINYSPNHTPVSVTQEVTDQAVRIRVTDRGIGIGEKDQQRVFERFFRVDTARSRQTGGTGLGLAIVKHVANNHNGSVHLWSSLGTGSTFTIELPRYREPDDDPSGPAPASSSFPSEVFARDAITTIGIAPQ